MPAVPAGADEGRASAGPVPAAWQRADAATEAKANEWMGRQVIGWTPNLGQIADASGHAASNVLFSTTRQGAQIFVTTTGISHYFLAREGEDEVDEERRPGQPEERPKPIEWSRLDLALDGAHIQPDHARLGEPIRDQGHANFYLAHCPDGVLDVPSYETVTFPEVYPGIDWVVRSTPDEGVHHDFIVSPGANTDRIGLVYSGASAIELSDDRRSLRIRTALGEVREGSLACFQDGGRVPVGARFEIEGSVVRVKLDSYDRSKPLVIDPPLVWSTYYGGNSFDGPRAIYCDNTNNFIYIVGYTNSTTLPTSNPGGLAYFKGTAPGGQDAFIWKFDQQGVRIWATYYGGSGVDILADCTVDASGNFYAGGYTMSTDLPAQNLAGAYYQGASGGATDAFLLEFNPGGVRQWATYFGGSGSDYVSGVSTDATGRLFAVGASSSTNLALPNPGGGAYYQGAPTAGVDCLLLRFSAADVLEWGTFFGGSDIEDAGGVTTTNGDLYVTGYTQSADFPAFNPGGGAYFEGSYQGGGDAFLARFTLAGVQTWTTLYGGNSLEAADQPAVDGNGNLFVFGDTYSSDFPILDPGGGAYIQALVPGSSDFFLLKFNSSNARVWATCYGGTDTERLGFSDRPLALDTQGNVYVTGLTISTDNPLMNPGGGSFFDASFNGDRDGIIGEFSNTGVLLWSTYWGSNLMDFGTGVSIGSAGCLFATGEVTGAVGFTTVNPGFNAWFQPTSAGDHEGYIAKFCSVNAACCLDNACIPVTSRAQCASLGGTQYLPYQTCATAVCTVNCTICGRKFNDVNRNGVQDIGEAGLPGWTIALYYPNGPLYGTVTTGANGNYCFNGIPCGTWIVAEVQQPGWVQTAPAGADTVTLGTGGTKLGVNFANYACATTVPCIGMPAHLAAWWPFSDEPGSPTAVDVTHANPARNVALVTGGGGATAGPDVRCFFSASDVARVPEAGQLDLNFAAGSFAIAAWISPFPSSASPRMIVEKRAMLSAAGTEVRGWALYLNGLQSFLEIATGGTPQVVPGPTVTPGAWSHLAISIDRGASQGRWYLNGDPATTFNFTPIAGLVSSKSGLTIGQVSPPFGTAAGFQGCIADLALFGAPLDAAAAKKAYDPGPIGWCPEFALMPQVKTFCKSDSTVQLCFNIFNNNATPQSYHWSLAGLPAGPGCSVAGPTQITPSAGVVNVPAGSPSAAICVTIKRPAGLVAQNATSCFALTFINDATGVCRSRNGTLRADQSCYCVTPIPQAVVRVVARSAVGTTIGIPVENPCDPIARLAYTLSAVWLDADHADPLAVRLNGLPPGTPVFGEAQSGSQIDVNVTYPDGYDPGARYEIVLEADTDGDGESERLCGTIVQAAYDSTEIVTVPHATPLERSVRLVTRPNPFLGGSSVEFNLSRAENVELGVYDLGGRRVRSLAQGQLEAGAHRFAWDGRDNGGNRVPAGVYFVRLHGGGPPIEAKLVKMR